MQMSLFDYIYQVINLKDLKEYDGMKRTWALNDIYLDWSKAKRSNNTEMEKFYSELLTELIKDYGH